MGILTGLFAAASFAATTTSASPPSLAPIADVQLLGGSPLHIALNGSDSEGQTLTFSAESANDVVTTFIPEGNRSLRMNVAGYGEMVFELFEGRVPRATRQIIALAESGFYNGVSFHRVINDFVIQGGDPTGTGSGSSNFANFDDQFHVDLQHNRTGLISMAKAGDDTNNSQFFITEGETRHLDFNHSIFGLLVEGEGIRNQISNVIVDSSDRPLTPVIMETVSVFADTQNAVLMLKAPEGTTGTSTVTVTVTNASGDQTQQTFRVDVLPDQVNSPPFLADIPQIRTKMDTPITVQLKAIDAEGDPAFYLDEQALDTNGLAVPVRAPANLIYLVEFETGALTVTPRNGLLGEWFFTVATAATPDAVDYQVVSVRVEP
jgi:cyclophilin family peptidyl-prolyl cis-trans isomerase